MSLVLVQSLLFGVPPRVLRGGWHAYRAKRRLQRIQRLDKFSFHTMHLIVFHIYIVYYSNTWNYLSQLTISHDIRAR